MTFFRQQLGRQGEKLAQDHLKSLGFRILAVNYRTVNGEIDIIAQKRKWLCFVEVKTRRNDSYGLPRESVHRNKQQKMIRAAEFFLSKNQFEDHDLRFDVIEVYLENEKCQRIEFIENAFEIIDEND